MPQPERIALVLSAVRQSLLDIAAEAPGEDVVGYAICTDDDVATVFCVATTEPIAASADVSIRWSAVEWPYGYASSAFSEVGEVLRASVGRMVGDDDACRRHVREWFATSSRP